MVETFLGSITDEAIRLETHGSLKSLDHCLCLGAENAINGQVVS
jgi:hypothetical protein